MLDENKTIDFFPKTSNGYDVSIRVEYQVLELNENIVKAQFVKFIPTTDDLFETYSVSTIFYINHNDNTILDENQKIIAKTNIVKRAD